MGFRNHGGAGDYAEGAGGFFKGIDALPLTGQYTHYALDKKTGKPDYVTDSAASATAWSTGVKTYNGALGVDIHKKIIKPFWRWQKRRALRPATSPPLNFRMPRRGAGGDVTSRKCYGPSVTNEKCQRTRWKKGGKGSITEQLLNARPDVTLGGGAKTFAETATAGEWQGKKRAARAGAGPRLSAGEN